MKPLRTETARKRRVGVSHIQIFSSVQIGSGYTAASRAGQKGTGWDKPPSLIYQYRFPDFCPPFPFFPLPSFFFLLRLKRTDFYSTTTL